MLLSLIVTDICTRAGLDSSSLDVTELTDDVLGYKIPRQMPARTALETLMAAYNFDAVERDWKLYFKKRGSTSVAIITQAEMRAHNFNEQPTDLAIETRTQDLELPTHFTLTYESKGRDYEVTSQNAVRVDKANFLQRESQIGIVLSDDYAKQQTEILLKQIWTNRHRYKFATNYKYLKLAPGDVITVNGKLMRVVEMVDSVGKVEFICESEAGGVYESAAEADDLTPTTPDLTETTSIPYFVALDIPAISEDFGNYGLTCAMYLAGGHNGGSIEYSIDGNYYTIGAMFSTVNAVVGITTASLSTGISGIIDNSTSLVVNLSTSGGSLVTVGSSVLWSGANLAAVGTSNNGYELLQFQTATSSTVANVYTITGFLRGLYGTNHLRGSHTTADKFILLTSTSGAKHGGVDFVSIPTTGNYLVRSVNMLGAAGTPQTENSGKETLIPYAPELGYGSRNSSNDVEIGWYRGDRYEFVQADFPDSSDIDQSEVSLSYKVNVIHPVSSAVIRTVDTTVSTWTYTAAMQSTDSYPNTHPIIFDIYQWSTVVSTSGPALRLSI